MRQKKEQCERENAKMLEFAGKIEEIKGAISITHYPQGVDHLIHSFKVMCNLMKVIYLYWIHNKVIVCS